MAVTVDCGEGKHSLCAGTGGTAYLFPQESRASDEPDFYCGCRCHHNGSGRRCQDPKCDRWMTAGNQPYVNLDQP